MKHKDYLLRYNQAAMFSYAKCHIITHSHNSGREVNKREGIRETLAQTLALRHSDFLTKVERDCVTIDTFRNIDGHEDMPIRKRIQGGSVAERSKKENPCKQDNFPKQMEHCLCTEQKL